ncbi:MAG TPA: hypothetical protein VF026_07975 [Ktedonobacteraceae bacterium]
MLDEDDQPVKPVTILNSGSRSGQEELAEQSAKIYYLHKSTFKAIV